MVGLAEQCSPVPSIVLPLDAIFNLALFATLQCLSLSIFMISVGLTDPNLKWALLGVGGAVVALVGGVSHNGDQVCAAG
jgi:hypothetical protein